MVTSIIIVMVDILVLFGLFLGVGSRSSHLISSSSSSGSRLLFASATAALWILTANSSTSATIITYNQATNQCVHLQNAHELQLTKL